jgi:hypothetical protein
MTNWLIKLFIIYIPKALAESTQSGAGATQSGQLTNPLSGTFQSILAKFLSNLITIALPVAVIMVVYGAFQMLAAGGDPEKFTKGRKTITYAAIGFGVVILAQGIVNIIQSLLS